MERRDQTRRRDTGTPGNKGLFDNAKDQSTLGLTSVDDLDFDALFFGTSDTPAIDEPDSVEVEDSPAALVADPVTDVDAFRLAVATKQAELDTIIDEFTAKAAERGYALSDNELIEFDAAREKVSTEIGAIMAERADHLAAEANAALSDYDQNEIDHLVANTRDSMFEQAEAAARLQQMKNDWPFHFDEIYASHLDAGGLDYVKILERTDARIQELASRALAHGPHGYLDYADYRTRELSDHISSLKARRDEMMEDGPIDLANLNLEQINETAKIQTVINAYTDTLRKYAPEKHAAEQAVAAMHADAYRQVVAEVREVGGDLELDPATRKSAAEVFGQAAQVYPADWIAYSNAQHAPLAKVSTRRAHYKHAHEQVKKQRVPLSREVWIDAESAANPYSPLEEEYVPLEGKALRGGRDFPYRHDYYEVAFPGGNRWAQDPEPGPKPKGNGWEQVTKEVEFSVGFGSERQLVKKTVTRWRRPRMETKEVSARFVPEILTEKPDKATAVPVAIHELAHRMEYTVPDIADMEQAFFRRRTIDPETGMTPRPHRISGYGRDEAFISGDFADPYIGKVYPKRGTRNTSGRTIRVQPSEILSMGMEALFGGAHGGLQGHGRFHEDIDHRNFVLGILATAGRSSRQNDRSWTDLRSARSTV